MYLCYSSKTTKYFGQCFLWLLCMIGESHSGIEYILILPELFQPLHWHCHSNLLNYALSNRYLKEQRIKYCHIKFIHTPLLMALFRPHVCPSSTLVTEWRKPAMKLSPAPMVSLIRSSSMLDTPTLMLPLTLMFLQHL